MNNNKRKVFAIIGAMLIIIGVIMFIVSATQLYKVQTTTTHWAEGFMQDYQARTNATNSIPCYMFMVLSIVMIIAGIIMLCIKPKSNTVLISNNYNSVGTANNSIPIMSCPNCKRAVSINDKFCKTCGFSLEQINQASISKIICPNCGQVNDGSGKFCIKCGNEI